MIRYIDNTGNDFNDGTGVFNNGEDFNTRRGLFGLPGRGRTFLNNGGGGFGGASGGTSIPRPFFPTPPRTTPVVVTPAPTIQNPTPAPVIVQIPEPTPIPAPTPIAVQPEPAPVVINTPAVRQEIETQAASLANDIVKDLINQQQPAEGGRVFSRFNPATDIVENQKVFLTTGLFSNTTNGVSINQATMSVMFTGSIQSEASKQYYYEAWNKNPAISEDSEPQFSIAYGHRRGSGSSAAGTLNDSPSRAIYSQYRLLLLNPDDTQFTLKDGTSTDSIYAINFNRARILEKVDPGNWQLTLAQLSGSAVANSEHTGSNVKLANNPGVISLIDDSGDTQEANVTTVGRIVNVVSGSILNGIHNPTNPHYYGLMYPETGIIILDGDKLNASASFNVVTGSNIAGDNAWKLFTSISGAFSLDSLNYSFQSRNSIVRTSAHYFVRVTNAEYNFSNNPTYVTGSEGQFSQPTFLGDPTVYITTVGMYNDRQELLAVGKLSKPIQNSFSKESLIKVRLDF
jgi:hypothetical protein